jgi:hypothetical protein
MTIATWFGTNCAGMFGGRTPDGCDGGSGQRPDRSRPGERAAVGEVTASR